MRSLSRRKSAGPGRAVPHRQLQDAQHGGFQKGGDRGSPRERNAKLPGEQDGHGKYYWPLRLSQGTIQWGHHPIPGRGIEIMASNGACVASTTAVSLLTMPTLRFLGGAVFLATVVGVLQLETTDARGDEARAAFRPCIDPNNLPFANTHGDGFENRIADLFARQLGLPVQNYAFPQRMNFIRNTLRYKLPGEDFRCDIVMSVPAGYDQTWTTAPYYRSTYVLVFPKGKGLDQIKTGTDLFELSLDARRKLVIGIYDRSPASAWLVRHGWGEPGGRGPGVAG